MADSINETRSVYTAKHNHQTFLLLLCLPTHYELHSGGPWKLKGSKQEPDKSQISISRKTGLKNSPIFHGLLLFLIFRCLFMQNFITDRRRFHCAICRVRAAFVKCTKYKKRSQNVLNQYDIRRKRELSCYCAHWKHRTLRYTRDNTSCQLIVPMRYSDKGAHHTAF